MVFHFSGDGRMCLINPFPYSAPYFSFGFFFFLHPFIIWLFLQSRIKNKNWLSLLPADIYFFILQYPLLPSLGDVMGIQNFPHRISRCFSGFLMSWRVPQLLISKFQILKSSFCFCLY